MSKQKKMNLLKKEKVFFDRLNKLIHLHPYFVVIILHEYFRNIFPADPHIKFIIQNPVKRISNLFDNLNSVINSLFFLGSYEINFNKQKKVEIKKQTGAVYGNLWKHFSNNENIKTKDYIIERMKNFKSIKFNNFFKDKYILDAGCGNGRYAYALSKFHAKKVVGIDYGNEGLKIGRKIFKKENLSFKKANLLKIPFSDNTFDFVFSNGVLHHTTNLKKGLEEVVRVCKNGGHIWLYLYGTGGLYWSSRQKMNTLMKKIPQEYSQKILNLIGMPTNRFIFMDNWYVPIEQNVSQKEIKKILRNLKVSSIEKMISGRSTDLENGLKKYKDGKLIWGEGEIRFLIKK